MSRALLVLNCRRERERAKAWIDKAPAYTRLEFKAPRRSLEQSALMWVLLGKIATQLPWHGIKLSADDWKLLMLDALKREVRMVPRCIAALTNCSAGSPVRRSATSSAR